MPLRRRPEIDRLDTIALAVQELEVLHDAVPARQLLVRAQLEAEELLGRPAGVLADEVLGHESAGRGAVRAEGEGEVRDRVGECVALLDPRARVRDEVGLVPRVDLSLRDRASPRHRLACLQALASVGPASKAAGLEILLREFKDTTNSIEVRRAIPIAIGEMVKAQEVSGDTFQVLKNALKEEDEQVWRNAGRALGKAKLTGEQAREVFQEQRIE